VPTQNPVIPTIWLWPFLRWPLSAATVTGGHIAPTTHTHLNLIGRYDFTTPTPPPKGTLRPLTAPA